jgi:hypothetical protein
MRDGGFGLEVGGICLTGGFGGKGLREERR